MVKDNGHSDHVFNIGARYSITIRRPREQPFTFTGQVMGDNEEKVRMCWDEQPYSTVVIEKSIITDVADLA